MYIFARSVEAIRNVEIGNVYLIGISITDAALWYGTARKHSSIKSHYAEKSKFTKIGENSLSENDMKGYTWDSIVDTQTCNLKYFNHFPSRQKERWVYHAC